MKEQFFKISFSSKLLENRYKNEKHCLFFLNQRYSKFLRIDLNFLILFWYVVIIKLFVHDSGFKDLIWFKFTSCPFNTKHRENK